MPPSSSPLLGGFSGAGFGVAVGVGRAGESCDRDEPLGEDQLPVSDFRSRAVGSVSKATSSSR